MSEAVWTAPDGGAFGVERWLPSGPPRALVVALHGMGCRAADFAPLGEVLAGDDVAVAAWSLRGQGVDPVVPRRGSWLELDGILDDLQAFVSTENARGLPLFLAGESMGALLALQAAVREPWSSRLQGLLLFRPVVALARKNPVWLKQLVLILARLLPHARLRPGWFVHGRAEMPVLTRVEERQRYLATAPHRLGPLSLRFLSNMGRLIESSAIAAERLHMPVAVFSSGHDVFTTTRQFEEFFASVRSPDKTRFDYPESYHQLLFDLDAPRVVTEAADWILSRISRKSTTHTCR